MGEMDYFASAFIRVKPDARGFRAQLREDVRRSVASAGTFKVPIEFDLRAFKQKLQREARSARVQVPIEPDMRGFREKLRARLASSTRGLSIKVPVDVAPVTPRGGTAGGREGGTGGGASRQSEAERQLAEATTARQRVQASAIATQELYEKAINETSTAQARLEALERSLQEAERGLAAATKSAATAKAQGRVQTEAAIREEAALLKIERDAIAAKVTRATADAQSAALLTTQTQLQKNATAALGIDIKAVTTRARLRQIDTALTKAETVAEGQLEAARRLGVTRLVQENEALLANIAIQRTAIETQRQAITTTAAQARQMEFLSRGAGATGLSLLGIRGATLAANAQFLIGAAAVTTFVKSVQAASGLETQLNVFAETSRATADELERVRKVAIQLGGDITLPGVTARDAAEAMTELAKAGLSVQDSIDGARGVLRLATAASIDNEQATLLAANAINAFGLAGRDASRVADLLANSANESQGSIEDVGVALQQSAAAARQAGFSVSETIALLTLLARNGLRASDAGTSLRTAILALVNPTARARKEIDRLNIDLRDAQGNLRSDVFSQIAESVEGLTRAEQDRIQATIFGRDAFRTQAILGREGARALDEMVVSVDRAGAAQQLAGARTAGFAGKLEALSNNIETVGTRLGALTLGPLGGFIDGVNDSVTAVNNIITALEGAESALGDFAGLFPGLELAGDKFGKAFVLDDILKLTAGGPILTTAKQINLLADTFGLGADKMSEDAKDVANSISGILDAFRAAGGGPSAQNEAVIAIQKIQDELEKGSPAAQQLARDIQLIIDQLQRGTTLPPFKFPEIEIPPSLRTGELGRDIADRIKDPLREALTGQPIYDIGQAMINQLTAGAKDAAPAAAADVGRTFTQSLATQIAVAEATGTESELLGLLRQRAARQQRFLDRMLAREQTPAVQKTVQKAAANLESTLSQIEAIENDRAGRAREARDKIVQARNEADRALLTAFQSAEGRIENRLIVAEGTKRLTDDIKLTIELRNLYRRQIREARERLRDAETRNEAIADLTRKRIQAERDLAELRQEEREAARDARREAREREAESLELDIQIAEATGNKAKEERARKAEIEFLKRRIRQHPKDSLERKRLILQLRQAQKELRELREEEKKTKDEFQAMAFEFLTRQQGFGATLLGNLLPLGALEGAVGGVSGPRTASGAPSLAGTGARGSVPGAESFGGGLGEALILDRLRKQGGGGGLSPTRALEGDRDGVRDRGITNLQATKMIQLMAQMVKLLGDMHRRTGHSESRRNQAKAGASMDTM